MRERNEIDFWRGAALLTIFVNHIPGIFFEAYTYRNFGISDAAEVFVFLAGWSVRIVARSTLKSRGVLNLVLRLEARAFSIYIAQIVVASIALAMTAAGALYFSDSLILEWNNAAVMFESPVEAQIGVVLLSHQLNYFDILPLYVVLIAIAPVVVLLDRISGWLLLAVSAAIYVLTLWFGVNIPTWPVEGRWFFNPLAWQFLFALGYIAADPRGPAAAVWRWRNVLRWIALPFVVLGVWVAWIGWSPDPLKVPSPPLFFMFDKNYVSPARIIHLVFIGLLLNGLFSYMDRWARPVSAYFSLLGRNSLNVFCAGSVLSLGGQFVRYGMGGGLLVDTAMLAFGVCALGGVAWLSEWRERVP